MATNPAAITTLVTALLAAGCVAPPAAVDSPSMPPLFDAGALRMGEFTLVEENATSALWRWEGEYEAYAGPPAPPVPARSSLIDVPPLPLRVEATVTASSLVADATILNPPAIHLRLFDTRGEERCPSTPGCAFHVHPTVLETWRFDLVSESSDPPSNPFRAELRLTLDVPPNRADNGGRVAVFGGPPAHAPVVGATVELATGFAAGEPTMGITSQGSIFATAWSTVMRSRDGGASWDAVHTHDLPNWDPILWVDPWTDCVYNVPLFPPLVGAVIYGSCDDGETWESVPYPNVGRGGIYDQQKFATALPGPDAPPVAGLHHPTVFVLCYNAGPLTRAVQTNCATSYDGGRTWPHDVPIWTRVAGPDCAAGQIGHPTGGPDGTIVVAKTWMCADPLVFVSSDSGVTWTMREGPKGIGADTVNPEIAFTDDGAMYMLWQSRRGEDQAYLARSDDLGGTWAGPWNVTPPGVGSSIFAALHGGSPGRVAMAFHATNHTTNPNEAPDDARWYTYVVTTENGNSDAPTFVSYRVQPRDDPVQVGSICNGNQDCHDGNRNLLDFIDGAVHPDGSFWAAIADGCQDGCGVDAARAAYSRAADVVMVRLDGWRLHDGVW